MNNKFITLLLVVLCCALTVHQVSAEVPPDCTLPLVTGSCKGYFRRFGYDVEMGQCVQFIHGGCERNANNFLTLEECERSCLV
ncbi:kunitz-type serine protease inhibitor Bt-KTI-like isoform X2 [Bombus vancouverensis nearcticus]|uniref:Kunitz-type serine protease inhibitor Bt-KTI-like isoform X1 n=1 Tax=Bombus bifarius TaxID=103933 RepID=A0A6P8N334_9HYME|nr:kunitz-type serine protease inhibitor Bt-KTI-like isoform X1 [Bombus vancouverensis nearcticus]XP_033201190.1 kunitz-type serine protease inhibitor Bt-KTI-like isoform X2 [Bombus vancouverensis nearcticus]XP_033315058.1 kunitz-type serine protease inhibitor Bt-KTI-like isoform X1 [Bombus bifarius]XP_033315059.1 kunitz-type serine protease inhibitor Bt-KTI-like isoform X2 [Bombus bifarius]